MCACVCVCMYAYIHLYVYVYTVSFAGLRFGDEEELSALVLRMLMDEVRSGVGGVTTRAGEGEGEHILL